jgi:NAD+ synthase (glutamine-hydrolysing)
MLPLAIAQLKPRKGAYAANLARVGELFRQLADDAEPPGLLVLPETALTGYFVEGAVRELARSAEDLYADLAAEHSAAGAPPMDIMVGFYELWRTRLHNSALAASLGGPDPGILHVHRKVFLPTYGVFDEERFVEPGRSVRAFDTRWGRAALIICEDAWHSLVPTIAALDGAQLLVIVSASPARGLAPEEGGEQRPASLLRWERTIQAIAGEHGIYVALAQLVGFEGGKGFPGGSLVVGPRGDVLTRAKVFEEDLLRVTVDLDEVPRVRADLPLLSDLELHLPHLLDDLEGQRFESPQDENGRAAVPPSTRRASSHPAGGAPQPTPLGTRAEPLVIDPEQNRRRLVDINKEVLI